MKPLHVQVAEALGWTDCRLAYVSHEPRWCGMPPNGAGVEEVPHYETAWGDTGPLIERLAISVRLRNPSFDAYGQWIATANGRYQSGAGDAPLLAVCNLILALSAAGELDA